MPTSILEKPSILAVVERRETRDLLKLALPPADYEIAFAGSREARIRAAQRPPSLAILDLSASRSGDLDLCRTMRAAYTGPIVALGPDGDEEIRVAAFEAGADQYLPKPFSALELWTRVQALLRRFPGQSVAPSRLRVSDLEIDVVQRRLYRAGSEVMLTATEFDLLVQLAQNPDHV